MTLREQNPALSLFRNAVVSTVNQVVEQNPMLCQRLYAQLCRDDVEVIGSQWQSLLKNLLQHCFDPDARYRLFLVLDGIDELDDDESRELGQFWRTVVETELRISLIVTSRSNSLATPFGEELARAATTIHITQELQRSDLAALVRAHLGTLGSLKAFSPYVKKQISEKLEATAPNLLYAHDMLLHFNSIGREGAVLGQLNGSLPLTLHGLYMDMLAVAMRRTVASRHHVAGILIRWLCFSFRHLLLDEVVSLLRHVSGDDLFELDDIPEVISRFVRVGDPGRSSAVQTSDTEYPQTGVIGGRLYNDGHLPVKFRQQAMRTFFCEAADFASSEVIRDVLTTASEAHRGIFLLVADMARPVQEGTGNMLHPGLAGYATLYLASHWMCIEPGEHSLDQRAEIMETLAAVMLNRHRYASISVSAGVDYESTFNDKFLARMALWATEVIGDNGLQLSPEAGAWWQRVARNPASGLFELARGQFETIYQQSDGLPTAASYLTARAALIRSGFGHMLAERAIINFPSIVQMPGQWPEEYDVLGLAGLFHDIPMSPTAYYSIASLLLYFGHLEPARSTSQLALSCNPGPVETIMLLYLQANSELRLGLTQEASQSITDCLRDPGVDGVPESYKRRTFVLKALVEARLGNIANAAKFFAQARTFDKGTVTMDSILDEEVKVFWNVGDHTGLINALRSWTSVERLNWLTHGSSGRPYVARHLIFQDAAARAGAHVYVEEVYQDAIKQLGHSDVSTRLRCNLAEAELLVLGDPGRARQLLDEVLDTDSPSSGNPDEFTDEDTCSVLDSLGGIMPYWYNALGACSGVQRVINLQSRVLRDLIVRSRDETEKSRLLDAMSGLMQRPLPLSVPQPVSIALLYHDTTIARMVLKMGPRGDFQRRLQKVIDACFAALDDEDSWNDVQGLTLLAQALAHLSKTLRDRSKLERAAQVLLSARFSDLEFTPRDDAGDRGGEEASTHNSEVGHSNEGPHDSPRNSDEAQGPGDDGRDCNCGGARTEQKDVLQTGATEQESDGPLRDDEDGNPGTQQDDTGSDVPDEGNLSYIPMACAGTVCTPRVWLNYWAGCSLYVCIDCNDTALCKDCYAALKADKDGTAPFQGRRFCGRDHEHIKALIEGWRGIKNGIMRIEGEKDVPFKEFLGSVRDKLLQNAWDEFWEG